MTKDQILADLDYASNLAKAGAQTPLLGGPIGLMWGILICAVFLLQWAILTQTLPLPAEAIAYMWIAFAIIGGTGTAILGRRNDRKTGANSVANKVETYVWIMFSAAMATLAFGIILNLILQDGSVKLWDFMVVAGFAGQGFAYGVIAKMTKLRWVHMASLASFIASAVCFAAYGTLHIYLVGAIAIVFTVIIPSLISMKQVA